MMPALHAASHDPLAAAVAYPIEAPALALCGDAGTGKTFALVERIAALSDALGPERVLATAATEASRARLGARLALRAPGVETRSLVDLAYDVAGAQRIDDAGAAGIFEAVTHHVFSLEWPELAAAHVDPEIAGLRSPHRFAAAAFRLAGKLRAGLVSPEAFREAGLRGATNFYARPPNFANPALLLDTPQKYRDSLLVPAAELERQRGREVDLVLVLARLYEQYVAALDERGVLAPRDALYAATLRVRTDAGIRSAVRARYACAAIDDAQELTGAALGLLDAIFGPELRGVTLCGDPAQQTLGFAAGSRGASALAPAACTLTFVTQRRMTPAIEDAAKSALDPAKRGAVPPAGRDAVTTYRAVDGRDEARFVAGEAARLIASGTAPGAIAVIARHLACAHAHANALLDAGIAVDVAGAVDLFDYPVVLDALAALWIACDPFRHEYALRALEAPWMRLCDASIATLCGEARDPQPLLFELPDDDGDEARAGRWDRRRDLRLGRNLTRGDVDSDLEPETRARVADLRAARERWADLGRRLGPAAQARAIAEASVFATLPAGVRGDFERGLVERLLARIDVAGRRDPLASLYDVLLEIERGRKRETSLEPLAIRDPSAVAVLDVEAAKGSEYDAVFVTDLRAGAWPRYYVPDAFLFMPGAGVIAKDNVGDAPCGRTARFTYALHRYGFKEKYNAEARRALYAAASRARSRLFLSAPGRPTKGRSTPELLSELGA